MDTPEDLKKLASAVMKKFEWLYFPLSVDDKKEDGTADLNVIFERLALREAMFCRPPSAGMYQTMEAADFVRNLLLGGFGDEGEAIEAYINFWLPVERKADGVGGDGAGKVMEDATKGKALRSDQKKR